LTKEVAEGERSSLWVLSLRDYSIGSTKKFLQLRPIYLKGFARTAFSVLYGHRERTQKSILGCTF
jgi:hypothetical protein